MRGGTIARTSGAELKSQRTMIVHCHNPEHIFEQQSIIDSCLDCIGHSVVVETSGDGGRVQVLSHKHQRPKDLPVS